MSDKTDNRAKWNDVRRTLHALAPDESDIPTLPAVRATLVETIDALSTHVQALQMAYHALRHTETQGDPERIAKVIDEIITPHVNEQIQTLQELIGRIPQAAEGGQS